jgi:hypothetical protein
MTDIIKKPNKTDVDLDQLGYCPSPNRIRKELEYKWLDGGKGHTEEEVKKHVRKGTINACVAQQYLADIKAEED